MIPSNASSSFHLCSGPDASGLGRDRPVPRRRELCPGGRDRAAVARGGIRRMRRWRHCVDRIMIGYRWRRWKTSRWRTPCDEDGPSRRRRIRGRCGSIRARRGVCRHPRRWWRLPAGAGGCRAAGGSGGRSRLRDSPDPGQPERQAARTLRDAGGGTRFVASSRWQPGGAGPGSRLVVGARHGNPDREVDLRGQAFFDVRHDDAHAFTVRAGSATHPRCRDHVHGSHGCRRPGLGRREQRRGDAGASGADAARSVILHQGDVGTLVGGAGPSPFTAQPRRPTTRGRAADWSSAKHRSPKCERRSNGGTALSCKSPTPRSPASTSRCRSTVIRPITSCR